MLNTNNLKKRFKEPSSMVGLGGIAGGLALFLGADAETAAAVDQTAQSVLGSWNEHHYGGIVLAIAGLLGVIFGEPGHKDKQEVADEKAVDHAVLKEQVKREIKAESENNV